MMRRQRGMTLIGWLITLMLLAVGGLITIRLVPLYMEAYSVGSILRSMESEARLSNASRSELRETFRKRLNINSIDRVDDDDLDFNDVAGGVQLLVDYEVRVHLLGNLDAIASFRREAVIRK